jgi:hypothetical protein
MTTKRSLLLAISMLLAISACEVDPPDSTDFSGAWNCSEQSSLYGAQNYQVQITNDSLMSGVIYMANFYNLGLASKVTVNLYGFEAEIPSQTLGNKNISGTGDLVNANKITLNYVVQDGIDADTVSSTLSRVL